MAYTDPLKRRPFDSIDAPVVGQTSKLSFIEPHEETDAKALVDKLFMDLTGKPFTFRPAGYMIACRIHIRSEELKKGKREDGTEYTIWMPSAMQSEDKYQSVSALVCAVGPEAFKGVNRDGSAKWPEGYKVVPGDFVVLPRHESFVFSFRGVAMALLPDDRIMGVIESPDDVGVINTADKV